MKKIPYYTQCTNPWEEFILHSDLSFSPCCFGPKVGKISSVEEIGDVWNGEMHVDGEKNAPRSVLNDSEWRILYNQQLRKIQNLQRRLKDFFVTKLDYAYDANGNIEGVPDAGQSTSRQTGSVDGVRSSTDPCEDLPTRPLAQARFKQGAFGEAGDLYESVCRADPSDTEALFYQAECRFQQGQLTVARLLFEEVLERDPHHPSARERLLKLKPAPAQKPSAVARMATASVP